MPSINRQEEIPPNVITKMVRDHKNITTCIAKYSSLSEKEEKTKWKNQLIYTFTQHAIAEELIVYPLVDSEIRERCLDELEEIKDLLVLIDEKGLDLQEEEKLVEKIDDLFTTHTINQEPIFSILQESKSEQDLEDLGKKFDAAKLTAPTRPHPVAKDLHYTGMLFNFFAAPLDRIKDLWRSFPEQHELDRLLVSSAGLYDLYTLGLTS